MTQEPQIIPLLSPADYQAGATDLDSINTGKLHKVEIVILTGAVTGNDAVIKCYAGATAGTKTTEIAFKYRKSGADTGSASADVFGARTAIAAGASGLVFSTAADWDTRAVTISLMSDELPEGKPWLTVETDDGSASVLFMAAVAFGWPRYSGDTHTTAL
jgi:hypothetical protein